MNYCFELSAMAKQIRIQQIATDDPAFGRGDGGEGVNFQSSPGIYICTPPADRSNEEKSRFC